MVKALAAGAVLVAAALPLAIGSVAGATTAPTLTYFGSTTTSTNIGIGATTASAVTVDFDGSGFANDGGSVSLSTTAPGVTLSSASESAGGAGTVSVSTSAATPGTYSVTLTDDNGTSTALAGALTIDASPTLTGVSPGSITAGSGSGTTSLSTAGATTVTISGTNFVSGATVTFVNTTNGTGLVSGGTSSDTVAGHKDTASVTATTGQGSATEASGTTLTVYALPYNPVSGSSASGTYSIVVTNPDSGTVTLAGSLTVTAFAVSNVTPSALAVPSSATTASTVTISGAGFQTGAKVTFSGTITGTAAASTDTSGVLVFTGGTHFPTGAVAGDFAVDATTAGDVTSGTYVTAANDTASAVTTGPAALQGAAYSVTLSTDGTALTTDTLNFVPALASVSTVSPTSITASVTVATNQTDQTLGVTVTNPSSGNSATGTLAGGLGIGEASTVAPTITATSDPTINVGDAASTITFTGTGLSQYITSAGAIDIGTGTTADGAVTINSCTGATGTTLSCTITVGNAATSGAHNVTLASSAAFDGAFTVAGPTVTSVSPSDIAVDAAVGTVFTFTGTGFNNTLAETSVVAGGATGLAGVLSYVSPTSATFAVTVSPTAASTSSTSTYVVAHQYNSSGDYVIADFGVVVAAGPSVSSITYLSGSSFGAGTTGAKMVINGSNFAAGATVTAFTNSNSVADTGVAFVISTITSSAITGTITIPAGDANLSDGYTVSNTDGGSAKVSAFGTGALSIEAGPTITAVTPATVLASSTDAFTITGTDFKTGAVVSLSSSNGTCGVDTIVSLTSITVSCTFSTAGASAVSLVVSNSDGGTATSTAVLAAASTTTTTTPPTTVKVPYTTGTHGTAVVGKTSTLTISGGHFYGAPKLTSNEAGTTAHVTKDSGSTLTVRITVKAGSAAGWHLLTIKLANGKTCKAAYKVTK
jgi:hypothetical protein